MKQAVRDDLLRRLADLEVVLGSPVNFDRHDHAMLGLVLILRAVVQELGAD